MKIKSITINRLLIILIILFMNFSNVFGQEPTPDETTKRALDNLINGPNIEPKKEYENNDRGIIYNNINSTFLNWSQKGEFEKQADYKIRMQEQSESEFIKICVYEIEKEINNSRNFDLDIQLLRYDAENEIFPIKSKFKAKEWENQVNISIDKAQSFKEKEWSNLQWNREKSNWSFISNVLFPSNIYLESHSFNITLKLPLSNQEEITVIFNDLGIENSYLKNFVFNYSKAIKRVQNKNPPSSRPSERIDYSTGRSLDGNGNYLLGGRIAIDKKIIVQKCNQSGTVMVSIEVDRDGKVIKAVPGVRGTTNNSKCLLKPAKEMALETKFNNDPRAPENQIGKIVYRFSLSE